MLPFPNGNWLIRKFSSVHHLVWLAQVLILLQHIKNSWYRNVKCKVRHSEIQNLLLNSTKIKHILKYKIDGNMVLNAIAPLSKEQTSSTRLSSTKLACCFYHWSVVNNIIKGTAYINYSDMHCTPQHGPTVNMNVHSFVRNRFLIIYYKTCFKVKILFDQFGSQINSQNSPL